MSYSLDTISFVEAQSDGRMDRRTFFVFFFLPDQEYTYIGLPISIISKISPPYTQG